MFVCLHESIGERKRGSREEWREMCVARQMSVCVCVFPFLFSLSHTHALSCEGRVSQSLTHSPSSFLSLTCCKRREMQRRIA